MTAFVVGCELHDDLHDDRYERALLEALAAVGAVRIFASMWLVSTALPMSDLTERLIEAAHGYVAVVALELKPGATWETIGSNDEVVGFLRQHIAP